MNTKERFLEFIDDQSAGCWLWHGATNKRGYGFLVWCDKFAYAHRVSYEIFVGPIPAGFQVDHLCRVTNCVNPFHLEAVTQTENARRTRQTHCKYGHPLSGDNLRVYPDGRRKCVACNRRNARAAHKRAKQ